MRHESDRYGVINLDTMVGVQTALRILGCDPGEADGLDGPRTQAAVRKFQEQAQIDVDGIVGPVTRGALANALEQLASSEPGERVTREYVGS